MKIGSRKHEIVEVAPTPDTKSSTLVAQPDISWHPITTVLFVVAIFLIAQVVAQIVISAYPFLHHWSAQQVQDWIDAHVWVQFTYTLVAYSILLFPIVWFLRRKGVSLSSIGLKRPRIRDAIYGLATFPFYFISVVLVTAIAQQLLPHVNFNQRQQIGFDSATGTLPLVLTFVSLAVIPPIVEETVMRGFVYTSLRAKMKLSFAIIITSALFAVGHLQFGSGAPLLWVAAIDTFVLSLFLIFLRQKTNSLWASITLHAFKNGLAFFYLFILHKV